MQKLGSCVWLLALYVCGIAHWVFLFSNPHGEGLADFSAMDWVLAANYQDVSREALSEGRIPYLMSFAHYSDRFLGLPETPLSPQHLFVLLLDDAPFHLFNILFLYTCACLGLLLLRRHLRLSYLAFGFLFLAFNFNGYLVSRVAAGHFMWYGYFFLPYFAWGLLRIDRLDAWVVVVFSLIAMLLQGSFHLYLWCLIYVALWGCLTPRHLRMAIRVLVFAMLAGAFRLGPAAVSLWGAELRYSGGFPSFGALLEGLTVIRDVRWLDPVGAYHYLKWWELDCYLGFAGLGLLLYFTLVRREQGNDTQSSFLGFDFANLAMLLLAFDGLLGLAFALDIPLLGSQRIASRLIVVPLVMAIILAAARMEHALAREASAKRLRPLLCFALVALAYDVYRHSVAWQVTYVDEHYAGKPFYEAGAHLITALPMHDSNFNLYVYALWLCYPISLAVCAYLFLYWWWATMMLPKQQRPAVL